MKATLAVCADRAVGALAALIGLVLLFLTARHLFAPIAPVAILEPSPVSATMAPAVAPRHVTIVRVRPVIATVKQVASIARGRVSRAAPHAVAHAVSRSHVIVRARLANVSIVRVARPVRVAARLAPKRSRVTVVVRAPAAAKRVHMRARTRPGTRRTPSPVFRIPARFDTRPALVTVSDASAASLPTGDALPTIVPHRRRR